MTEPGTADYIEAVGTLGEFFEDYGPVRERLMRTEVGVADADLGQCRVALAEAHGFLARWRDHPDNPEVSGALDSIREFADSLRPILELIFLERLFEVFRIRHRLGTSQSLTAATVEEVLHLMAVAPEVRPELEEICAEYLDENGRIDRDRFHRGLHARVDHQERAYRSSLEQLAIDFPERVTAELRERFERADPDDFDKWRKEMVAQSRSLKAQLAEDE